MSETRATGSVCDGSARSRGQSLTPVRLLARVRNDRYDELEHAGDQHVRGWNACSRHIERLIEDELRDGRTMAGLRELRDAKAIDLRLRRELMLGDERAAAAIEQAEKAGC